MPHMLVIEISNKEKMKILDDIFEDTEPRDHAKFLIKSLKELSLHLHGDEKDALLAEFTKILGAPAKHNTAREAAGHLYEEL